MTKVESFFSLNREFWCFAVVPLPVLRKERRGGKERREGGDGWRGGKEGVRGWVGVGRE